MNPSGAASAVLLVVAFLLPAALPLQAQSGQSSDPAGTAAAERIQAAQSAARAAIEAFEEVRRRAIPTDHGWSSGRCDIAVGRMCWRYHEGRQPYIAHDIEEVTEARDSLLQRLASISAGAEGDTWLLGQRTFYLLEAGRGEEALELAEQCGGTPAWRCQTFQGLALHVLGRYAEAGHAFDGAIASMDQAGAADWTDFAPLLDGGLRDLLDAAVTTPGADLARPPDRRAASNPATNEPAGDPVIQQLWRLADPLFLVPGNDRRTEHFARRVVAGIVGEGQTPYRVPWGKDMAELVERYGWERGWVRVLPRPGDLGAPVRLVGFQHPDLRRFLPPANVLANATALSDEPWAPSMWASAQSGYAPAYAPVFLPMASRIVVLPRGRTSLVAATYLLPADTTWRTREQMRGWHSPPAAFSDHPAEAGVFLLAPDGQLIRADSETGSDRGVLIVNVPTGDYLVSVEALAAAAGRAGRRRNGLRVPAVSPDSVVLSDPLVLEGDTLPDDVVEALERLRLDDRIAAGETIVLGWELWGPGWSEASLSYRLTVEPTDPGLFGRIRSLFGVEREITVVSWQESAPEEAGAAFRSATIAIPALPAGAYMLRLEVTAPDRQPLVSEVGIQVIEADAGGAGGGP